MNDGYVRDIVDASPLTLKKLGDEIVARARAKDQVASAAQDALKSFAEFLRTPKVQEGLAAHQSEAAIAGAIAAADHSSDIAEILHAAGESECGDLAKVLEAVAGGKKPKSVKLSELKPSSDMIWDRSDIPALVEGFRRHVEGEWEEVRYLKVEP